MRTNVAEEDFLFDTDEGPVNVVPANDVESVTRFSVCRERFKYAK